MPCNNRTQHKIKMKIQLAMLEQEYQHMEVELEFTQKQVFLIRESMDEKQDRMRNLTRRLRIMENSDSNPHRESENEFR